MTKKELEQISGVAAEIERRQRILRYIDDANRDVMGKGAPEAACSVIRALPTDEARELLATIRARYEAALEAMPFPPHYFEVDRQREGNL